MVAIVLVVWDTAFRNPGVPKVLRFIKLTGDGERKPDSFSAMECGVYFDEALPDGRTIVAQVSVKGGEARLFR